ncbi:MAG: hypothetical protein JNL57_06890 [Bacteroidetes bacterium]|nr:hypothetical protein [Bacteroidota bacterium]
MKKNRLIALLAVPFILGSCAGLKKNANTSLADDAYFQVKDLDSKGVYAISNVPAFNPDYVPNGQATGTRSYGQSYTDRLRNFNNAPMAQPFRPAIMVSPMVSYGMPFQSFGTRMYNPYAMYNPYSMYSNMGMYNPYMNPYNPYFNMGYNPYSGFGNDPYWCYYNQMYNPYGYYGGYSNWSMWNNSGTGSNWSPSRAAKPASSNGFNNSGTRRTSYTTGTPASTRSSGYGSGTTNNPVRTGFEQKQNSWGSGSSGGGFNTGSSGSRQNSWGSGGSSGSSSGSQSGTSGRRR